MDKQTESRSQFEAEFKRRHSFVPEASMALMLEQYNFGTDEDPLWGYYSLSARDAWEWWKVSRESLVVDLPQRQSLCASGYGDGYFVPNDFGEGLEYDEMVESLRAIGIRIKGEGV
ncbi:hypothetical protein AV650_15440 [Serratia fonticola]|nr:hypothetical protein AV650_15440 [Serratia fonticola]